MVDQIIRAEFDFSNTPGAMPNRAIPQGGAAIQQADGKLLTIKPNGTLRVTDIRDIVEQLATGPLATVLGRKADLVDGLVPLTQLPPGLGGGGGGPITLSQISDLSSFWRPLLSGGQAVARTALGLGAAAYLAVGVSGGVAAYDDPRFGTGGGGGAPSTVTASQISDASGLGRSVLTGSQSQALTALGLSTATTTATLSGLSSSLAGITVKADPLPAWATFKTNNDSLLVNANGAQGYIWPGGGDYACMSAITGALRLPVEAGANNINGGPAIIIASGVMGLALSECLNNVVVGGYFSGGCTLDQGRAWGINTTVANGDRRGLGGYVGKNGQFISAEIDLNLNTPPGGWAGTNAYGASIVAVAQSQPDGGFTGLHISAIDIGPKIGWKEAIRTDPGACDEFAQIHTQKYLGAGASGSQKLHFISSPSTNQFRHGFISQSPGGDLIIQPDMYNGSGQFTVANSTLQAACTMHPTGGFNGPSIYVSGNMSAGGNGGVSGNFAVGALTQTQLLTVGSTASFNGDVNVNGGLLSTSRLRFGNADVQVQAPGGGPIPNGFKALMVAG
ncbi:hypothetical protein ASF22_02695 [Methylobacterium sp. Leaf87]|uniref:hypothetical protein n=1 Tax=Methylobacterium sp. Leaf87 TaxID=1736243 RepID=UPI0006FD18F3|nr:hypothetical protein [Methylobacterium sp. Leaf87]KQO69535.1 hypothetical protein ASF22_02695 [Methylobacterium sp. Leaf87]